MSKQIIGKVSATERNPNTVTDFHFWTHSEIILKPFDVVVVEHIKNSKTYGVVEEISHVTDTPSFLASYVSSDFGDVDVKTFTKRLGMNYVKASVSGNNKGIFIPVLDGKGVRLATRKEILEALGLDKIKNPLLSGYIDMYSDIGEKTKEIVEVNLDKEDILGPRSAHLNISGISGLATKTSYGMFMVKSLQDQHIKGELNENIAYIVFNVKGRDLLRVDEPNNDLTNSQKQVYKKLNVNPLPLENVNYFYPYHQNFGNTYVEKEVFEKQQKNGTAKYFGYQYSKVRENIDLFFGNTEDPTGTMESVIDKIITDPEFSKLRTWNDFRGVLQEKMEPGRKDRTSKEIMVASWRKFYRIINKFLSNQIFIQKHGKTVDLREHITQIKGNEIFVIDISKLQENLQSFIFGDVLGAVRDLKLGGTERTDDIPDRIVIFMDELNKYASKEKYRSPICTEILDVTERGRSLGIILFGAEQFKSELHDRVTGNTATNVYGRTNSMELSKTDYRFIPPVYKSMLQRVPPGELIIQSPQFRTLIKIKFPFPSYHQPIGK
jgi:hypothetical protein|tara:strand:+ start:299 stop:1948 length:1650 start_codon:yes stop_codon:yes gene_type:complete